MSDPGITKTIMIERIAANLLHRNGIQRVLGRLDEACVTALRQFILIGANPQEKHVDRLLQFGLVIDGQVPDDLAEVCCPLFVKQVLRQFPAISEPCMPSTFLKTVLIAVAIHKNASAKTTHSKKNCLKNVAKSALLPHDDYSVHCALDYLESEKMVTWLKYENRYCLAATPELLAWFHNDTLKNLRYFYSWIIHKTKMQSADKLVVSLGRLQETSNSWIEKNVFSDMMRGLSMDWLYRLGLIRFWQPNQHETYIQLTPEGWYLSTSKYPLVWEKGLQISADSEIFVPHNYDPMIVALMNMFCKLTANDYFLVFDLDELHIRGSRIYSLTTFLEAIQTRCEELPSVVQYQIEAMQN